MFSSKGKQYQEDIVDRVRRGELFTADSIHVDKSLACKTLRKGRTVYGGGGIIPDVFVPVDTVIVAYTGELLQHGIPDIVVMNYLRMNQEKLQKQYTGFNTYLEGFQVPEELLRMVADLGKQRKIAEDKRGIPYLKSYLKAMIAQRLYTISEFYQVKNQTDEEFLKAVEVLDNWDRFAKEIQ